jgi:hypothetical protein
MAESIESFAARVMHQFSYTLDSLDEVLTRELPAFIAAHTSAPACTGRQMYEAWSTANDLAPVWGLVHPDVQAKWNAAAATLRTTRNLQWVPKPDRTPAPLVVPEDGWYAKRFANASKDLSIASSTTFYKRGEVMLDQYAAIVKLDGGTVMSWVERDPTPAGWTADDIPAGHVVLYGAVESVTAPDGRIVAMHRGCARMMVAERANDIDAYGLAVLPEDPGA